MKKDTSSLSKIPANEIMTLAENLAFLAGFAEGIAKGSESTTAPKSTADDIECLIAEIDIELPENGWKPTSRF
jgi:hypothetical protein